MPQRFLRPGLTTSKKFNRVSWEAQTFYVRLLTLVDDYGRYEADRMLLRSLCFPIGDPDGNEVSVKTVENICDQLLAKKLLVFYPGIEGKEYLQLTNWKEHARAASKFPAPSREHLQTIDNKCSPPSSSSSSSSSSASDARGCLQVSAILEKGNPQASKPENSEAEIKILSGSLEPQIVSIHHHDTPVELPPRFPATQDEAEVLAEGICLKDFAGKIWQKAMSRGGSDARGQPIRSWRHYLKAELNYETDRKEREKNYAPRISSKPNPRNTGLATNATEQGKRIAEAVAKRSGKPLQNGLATQVATA